MIKKLAAIALMVLSVLSVTSSSASAYESQDTTLFAKRRGPDYNADHRRKHNYPRNQQEKEADAKFEEAQQENSQNIAIAQDDKLMVAAVERRRRVDFVEGAGMVVVKLLPDDNHGLPHQKWIVRLSNGAQMQAVYNSDMENCDRVDIKVGDLVAMGGQFIYTNEGPMLHWLHYDPRRNRPDGYVEVNGKMYCKDGPRR